MKRKIGQSTAEYALLAGIIGIAALGALLLLGSNLRDTFVTMLPSSQAAARNRTLASGGSGIYNIPAGAKGLGAVSLTLPSGKTFQLGNHPVDIRQAVATAGTNGATEMLLASLESLARQLLASGEITEAQANGFIDLANQGHRISAIEALVEEAMAASGGDRATYLATRLQFDGQPWQAFDLAAQVGVALTQVDITATDPFASGRPAIETDRFIELYNQLKASGALNNPQVDSVVTSLSRQIVILSDTVDDRNWFLGGETDPLLMKSWSDIQDIEVNGASHAASAGVCTTGSGTDTGVSCS